MQIIDMINAQIENLKDEYEENHAKNLSENCLEISGGIQELQNLILKIIKEES